MGNVKSSTSWAWDAALGRLVLLMLHDGDPRRAGCGGSGMVLGRSSCSGGCNSNDCFWVESNEGESEGTKGESGRSASRRSEAVV